MGSPTRRHRSSALVALALAAGACSTSSTSDDADAGDPHGPHKKKPPTSVDASIRVTGPERLSETGLYASGASGALADGVLTFAPRFPLWSDGSDKERFVWLPPGTKVDTSDMDEWIFPIGTKAWKHFRIGGKLVETRLLEKKGEGPENWWMVSYVWDDAGADAIATPVGQDNVAGTQHDIPKQEQCLGCHMHVRDAIIGFSAIQLTSETPPSTLATIASLLSNPPATEPVPPGEGNTQLALGTLHGNCGNCHKDGATRLDGQSAMRLRLRVSDTTPESTAVLQTSINLTPRHPHPNPTSKVIVPGNPDESQLYQRMLVRGDEWMMPPFGSERVDPTGSLAVRDWIAQLP